MNPSYYSAILWSSILDINCHICIHCRKATSIWVCYHFKKV